MTKSIANRSWTRTALAAAALAALSGLAAPAQAQTLDTVRIASAMALPLFVTSAPGEPYFIYILLKGGRIVRQDLRTNTQTDFIDLNPIVVNPTGVSDERGLLGLAFHPRYQQNGYFYVYYTANNGRQIVARYSRTSPGVGDSASASILLDMADPFTNHNGGWMAFAPGDTQGYLYISTGDGGSAGDPNDAGQNLASVLGKMLRVDVDGPDNIVANADDDAYPADATINTAIPTTNPFVGGSNTTDDLIWAYGLRNSWRCSFDRTTGAFYIGDVGQNNIEEINFQAAGIAGGQNYGWRCWEGNSVFSTTGRCSPLPTGAIFPFHTYDHSIGISVTGGYVYRGCAIPAVSGHYFYADYGTARVWTRAGTSATAAPTGAQVDRTSDLSPPIGGGSIASLASFGEDAFGEMYIVRHSSASGEVFRIIPQGGVVDCNANNVSDCGEIALGLVVDCNANGAIDSCEIASNAALDCDRDGALDSCEIASNAALDCDRNGALDSCQIAANAALDCNANGAIDSCEIAAAPALDCNNNGILDSCDIASGFSQDTNNNNTPDECEACPGDANGDNAVNFDDVTSVLGNFGATYEPGSGGLGDANNDGSVNFDDVTTVLGNFGGTCN